MYIESKQVFIFSGVTERGQICLVEPKSYKRIYLLPPKQDTDVKVEDLEEDTKYTFVLAVIVDVKAQKALVGDKVAYLNEVKMYINDILECESNA